MVGVGVVSKYTVMMKKIVLPIVLVLVTLLPPVLPASLRECLLGYKLLHPATGRCFTALERGPCQAGSWLVPSGGGEAECRPETTGQCDQPVVLTGGEVGCLVELSTNLANIHCAWRIPLLGSSPCGKCQQATM